MASILHPAPFPHSRPRRLRRHAFSRALVQENHLRPQDLILPVFVLEGEGQTQPVASMPGVSRFSVDRLFPVAEACVRQGIPVMALFPVIDPARKSPDGAEALNPEGLVPRTVQAGPDAEVLAVTSTGSKPSTRASTPIRMAPGAATPATARYEIDRPGRTSATHVSIAASQGMAFIGDFR